VILFHRAQRFLAAPIVASLAVVLAVDTHAGESTSPRPPTETRRAAAAPQKTLTADRFVRVFRASGEEAKRSAVSEAGQSHRENPNLADALWQVIDPARGGKGVSPALLSAVRLYAELPSEEHSGRQTALLAAGDARVVLAAVDGLASRQAPNTLAPSGKLRRHPEYSRRYAFRHQILSAVAQYREPAAIDWLIETLAASKGQLKYEAARNLARLTGENFGGKSDEWRAWWSDHQDKFAAAVGGPIPLASFTTTAPVSMPWDESVPTFFNLPIYARRVVFVVDCSKSMESSVNSVTRLDEVQRELEQAVRGMADGTLFDLVAYDTTQRLWKDRLVPATLQTKSESVRFIYSLSAGSKTACYDALESALALDPNLELIVFLSDGEPNAGRIIDPQHIVQEISAHNAARRVRIDVLGIDARGPSKDFLKNLAESNFGAYRPIR
jgi:von Willebrand factor type A domain